jgi:hypothetical protein
MYLLNNMFRPIGPSSGLFAVRVHYSAIQSLSEWWRYYNPSISVLIHTSRVTCPIVSVIWTVERHRKCSVHSDRRVCVHSISACPWTPKWMLLCSRSQTAFINDASSHPPTYSIHTNLSLWSGPSLSRTKPLMWTHLWQSSPHICIYGSYGRPITNQTTPCKKR